MQEGREASWMHDLNSGTSEARAGVFGEVDREDTFNGEGVRGRGGVWHGSSSWCAIRPRGGDHACFLVFRCMVA